MNSQSRFPGFVRRFLVPAVLAFSWMGPSWTNAREYEPFMMYVFPAGGQRGTTVEGVMARGRGLEGTSEVRISGEGVTAKVLAIEEPSTRLRQRSANRQDQAENPNVVKFSVTIAPDAEPGLRDLWLITPKGPTNRRHFAVGQLPEVNELDEEAKKDEPQPLASIPILVNGQYNQQDHDIFRFPAKAGQTLICEVEAQKLVPYIPDAVPGWFQPCLTLYDSAGNELAYVDDFRFHPDPLLIYKVEKDGEYLIEVQDALFRGREDLIYRLSISTRPYLTHVYPLGGPRNAHAQVELHGANLPAASTSFSVPADSPPLRHVRVKANGMTSNALPFAVGDTPEAQETEPNDAIEQANKIETPVTVNGRIQKSGDVDYLRFTAKKNERLVVDVRARRLESPLDSIITLLNASGGRLAENDDTTDLSQGLITHHADSYLAYTIRADGDYLLRIADVQGQGGEEYAYRIRITPPRPDFQLRVVPANLAVGQGASGLAKVKAYRQDGFNEEISISVEGLPPGCVATPAVIPRGQNEVRLTITAPPDAPTTIVSPTFVGTAPLGAEAARAEKKAAEDALAKLKAELAKANAEYEAAEKAAGEAETAAAQAKATATQEALDKTAAQKRKLAGEAKAKRDKLAGDEKAAGAKLAEADKKLAAAVVRRQAVPAEELMQAFYYWQDVPTEEFLMAVVKPSAFTLSSNLPPAAVQEVRQDSELSVVVKASREGLKALLARAEAEKKAADEALAKVKADIQQAKTDYEAAEKAAKEAEAAVRKAKAATAQAAAAQANAEKAASAKRQAAERAKQKRDDLVQNQQKPAEANLATAAKAATDATNAKSAADKALADAQAATAAAQQAYDAAEQAAQQAEANAQAVSEDAAKSEEEKKTAAEEAAAKRTAADAAKTALTQAQQNEQQAQTQTAAAAKMLAHAEAQKKSADEALANVKNQVAAATTAYQAAEKAAAEAMAAAAKAKAEADKARTAQAAAEKAAAEKRKLAKAAKAKRDQLPNSERAANTKVAEAKKKLDSAQTVIKAAISLKADPAPRGITVKAANLPADQNEATVTLTVTKQAPAGVRQNIILVGTIRAGGETFTCVAPAIPIQVVAPPK